MKINTALITGASRGLGKTLATYLAGMGTDLILTARGREDLYRTVQEISFNTVNSGKLMPVPGDVKDPTHRSKLSQIVHDWDGLNLLINNASTLGPTPLPKLKDAALEDVRRAFEINTLSPLALSQELLSHLEKNEGVIINISSDAAVGGYEGWGVYGASKAALDLFSSTMANELRDHNVSVLSIDPGDMRTTMHQAAFPGEDISDRPLPDETLPFWAWLFSQDPASLTGKRFKAQSEQWHLEKELV